MDNIFISDTLVCTVQLIYGKLQNYPWKTPIDRQARKSISPADRVSPIECVIKNTQKGNGVGREESMVDQLRATPLKSHLSVAVFNWQMRQMRDETTLCERRECNIAYSSSVYIIIGNI